MYMYILLAANDIGLSAESKSLNNFNECCKEMLLRIKTSL
jgi:hypothetical protein